MIKVAVTDDHKLVRKSISALINNDFDGIEVMLEAENGLDLLEGLKKIPIDLVLLDIQMPVMDGYETCQILSKSYPEIKVLIVSHLATKESIYKTLNAGAHGYFSKGADPQHLEDAIRGIFNTGFFVEPQLSTMIRDVIFWDKNTVSSEDPLSLLTNREILLITLAAKGLSDEDISEKLSITIRTVQTSRHRIIDKSNARNFLSVILMALKYKYISVEDL